MSTSRNHGLSGHHYTLQARRQLSFATMLNRLLWVWNGDEAACLRVVEQIFSDLRGRHLTQDVRRMLVSQARAQMPNWLIKAKNVRWQNLCKEHPHPHVLVDAGALPCSTCRMGDVEEWL